MMLQHAIHFGSKVIHFELQYSERKTLGITVTPELKVIVKAPNESSLDKIEQKIKKRAPWIIKQQNHFLNFYPRTPKKLFAGGESHFYLGRSYKLEIVHSNKKEVSFKGGFLRVDTNNSNKVESLIRNWYANRAKVKFAEIAMPLIERFKSYNVEPTSIYVQKMSTRWGSCTPSGKIILNPELIKAHKKCIEYVIIHELCHLVHHNHTANFFKLQTKEMPDWEKWKAKLESFT